MIGGLALTPFAAAAIRIVLAAALALGLPDGPARPVILAATYSVVLFCVIGQGGTIKRVLERLTAKETTR
jgi:CPA1 family monovalent cation:H+ antiporter